MFFERENNGFISCVVKSELNLALTKISATRFNEILERIAQKPKPTQGYDYALKKSDLTWELFELPPEHPIEEEATAEDYESALERLGVDV